MIPLHMTKKSQELHKYSQMNLFRNHRLKTNKQANNQTNKNTSFLNVFSLYWIPVCSLSTADKFIGYIYSQCTLMMNHQGYTVVSLIYYWPSPDTVIYHRILSYQIRHHCLFHWAPSFMSLCWCVMLWKCQSSSVFSSFSQSTSKEASTGDK